MGGFFEIYLFAGLSILGFLALLWLISLFLHNSSIVDIFWGMLFVISVWIFFSLTTGDISTRKWLITAIATIWGLRLSIYILWRNKGKSEDFRYAKWRQENGTSWWWRSYFKVFLLQGILCQQAW